MLRLIVFLLALLPTAALGQQNTVRQSGTVSPNHAACWTISGVVQDCTPGGDPALHQLGIWVVGTGTFLFLNSNTTAGPFNELSLAVTSSDFILSDTAFGGATHIPLQIITNGFINAAFSDANTTLSEVLLHGTAPVVSSGSGDCGTNPAIAGNDNVGRVTVGSSTNGGKCTVTFSQAYPHAPICFVQDETSNSRAVYAATSTTAVVITAATTLTAADSLVYSCAGYN